MVATPAPFLHPVPAPMYVEIVDTQAAMLALKPAWEALEKRDPEATVFLSWAWLAAAFRQNPGRWRVLVMRRDDEPEGCICVLPLKYRVHWSKTQKLFQSEIEAGGRLIWSEYTGFLCDPDYENRAIDLIAGQLRQMPWSRLSMRYVASLSRAKRFMNAFPGEKFSTHWKPYRISAGKTDNLVCPQVALPESYEGFLGACLGSNTRQKVRRLTRRHIDSGETHVTVTDADSFDRNMDALSTFWISKWTPSKGRETAIRVAGNYRRILENAQALGLLYMPVMWQGDKPIALLGHILDPQMKRVHFIVAGRDEATSVPSVGLLLHAQAIRWAIEQGYEVYDFCHGDEAYKYTFGAQDLPVGYFSIRRSAAAQAPAFDPLSATEALRRLVGFLEAGQSQNAKHAARQLLASQERAV